MSLEPGYLSGDSLMLDPKNAPSKGPFSSKELWTGLAETC